MNAIVAAMREAAICAVLLLFVFIVVGAAVYAVTWVERTVGLGLPYALGLAALFAFGALTAICYVTRTR